MTVSGALLGALLSAVVGLPVEGASVCASIGDVGALVSDVAFGCVAAACGCCCSCCRCIEERREPRWNDLKIANLLLMTLETSLWTSAGATLDARLP